jgi:hypothetical protein
LNCGVTVSNSTSLAFHRRVTVIGRDVEGKERGLTEVRGSEFVLVTEANCTSLRTDGVPVRIGKYRKLRNALCVFV